MSGHSHKLNLSTRAKHFQVDDANSDGFLRYRTLDPHCVGR